MLLLRGQVTGYQLAYMRKSSSLAKVHDNVEVSFHTEDSQKNPEARPGSRIGKSTITVTVVDILDVLVLPH